MNTPHTLRCIFAALGLLALATGPALRASDAPPPGGKTADPSSTVATDKPAAHPPLKLQFDSHPIDRNAPDHVSYANIIKKTAASVVFVYSSKKVRGQDISPFLNDPFFKHFFDVPGRGNVVPGAPRGRMPDQVEQGLGSGIVISSDGYILTNNHVVEGADEVKVSIGQSTKKLPAKIIGRDSLADIAVLKIEPTGSLVPATFGDSDQLQVGDTVLAIGDPFGIGQSVSRGIVSALSRGQLGIEQLEDFIQTDAAINPGNSGGALIDSEGRVVGINTAILSSSGGFNGVGLAIPINLVRFVAEQIVNKGHVDRGFLGVQTQELTDDIASQFGVDHGALVTEVTPDSPAEKAGLKAGDVITRVNATDIRDPRHLQLLVTQLAPDTAVTIAYIRDNKPASIHVTLGLRPNRLNNGATGSNAAQGNDEGVLNGVTVGDITSELREELQIPARIKGAIITDIEADSPSAQQGLQQGDVIMELDRKTVQNADEAVKLSGEIKGPKVMVLIWRAGGTRFVVIDESKK
ncbi:MAG TPA: Do family serine endopeptidase [Opitutaceae bacterium]|nr:Do family serine endopeptidase [Opitutaceae bacterium]